MHYQNQKTIAYLESENTPVVDLSAFKHNENQRTVIKDLKSIKNRADKVKLIPQKQEIESVQESNIQIDGNIERRVRPMNLDFIMKKEKNITWL